MPDYLGNIQVPEIVPSGVFPLVPDYPHGRGEVRDYAEISRLGYVSRARITQVMNLLNLAPDIQGKLIELQVPDFLASERQLRKIVLVIDWGEQRRIWSARRL